MTLQTLRPTLQALVDRREITVSQRGKAVDLKTARGPIRVRLPSLGK
jgi:hypothetical protein